MAGSTDPRLPMMIQLQQNTPWQEDTEVCLGTLGSWKGDAATRIALMIAAVLVSSVIGSRSVLDSPLVSPTATMLYHTIIL